jgi:F0F1-type ATP synthase assembly protein I
MKRSQLHKNFIELKSNSDKLSEAKRLVKLCLVMIASIVLFLALGLFVGNRFAFEGYILYIGAFVGMVVGGVMCYLVMSRE